MRADQHQSFWTLKKAKFFLITPTLWGGCIVYTYQHSLKHEFFVLFVTLYNNVLLPYVTKYWFINKPSLTLCINIFVTSWKLIPRYIANIIVTLCRHTGNLTLGYTNTPTKWKNYTQTHRHKDTQTQIHSDTQTHGHAKTHRHTNAQTRRHTDTQTRRHTDTQTLRHTANHAHSQTNSKKKTGSLLCLEGTGSRFASVERRRCSPMPTATLGKFLP